MLLTILYISDIIIIELIQPHIVHLESAPRLAPGKSSPNTVRFLSFHYIGEGH